MIMGFYVEGQTKSSAMKKARRVAPNSQTVKKIGKTRHDGLYYASTKTRKGFE